MKLQVSKILLTFKYSHDADLSSVQMPSSPSDIHQNIKIEDKLSKKHHYIKVFPLPHVFYKKYGILMAYSGIL